MVNKNYVNGRRFEYKVKKYLEKMGFLVMRTAGSHSPFDLVAVESYNKGLVTSTTSIILFVQCKNRKPTKQERIDFTDAMIRAGIQQDIANFDILKTLMEEKIGPYETTILGALISPEWFKDILNLEYFKVFQPVFVYNPFDQTINFRRGLTYEEWRSMTSFETIRRARQKLQEHNPDLLPLDKTVAKRAEREENFREMIIEMGGSIED